MKWKENNEKQTNSRAGRKPEMAGQSDLSWSHYAKHADLYYCSMQTTTLSVADDAGCPGYDKCRLWGMLLPE